MKYLKKYLSLIFIPVLLWALLTPAAAAEEPYTYTVRFFAGNQGTFDGESELVISGLNYGDRVTFRQDMVTLNDGSKYYVQGIRESGKDNNTVSASAFRVTGDMDYVVAYGIWGSSVAYTVNYQDEAGRALAPSETHYGNVGDKPVIAYIYVDGYQPRAYNLTGTLHENAAENVFTFVYTQVISPDASQPGGQGTAGGPGTQDGENNPATQPGTAPEEATATPSAPADSAGEDTDSQGQTEPQEIEDLDDFDVPLAPGNADARDSRKFPVPVAVVGGVGFLGILVAVAVAITRRKKDKK